MGIDKTDELTARINELEKENARLKEELRHREEKRNGHPEESDSPETLAFDDLFDVDEIQSLQDKFASTINLASIITLPDGTPVTRPSNFCRLCSEIIRNNPRGQKNCFQSDAAIGRYSPDGPIVMKCRSGSLWDAGAAIVVRGKHIANWLIGQVRDIDQPESVIRDYARKIGADEDEAVEAYREVPYMSEEQFRKTAEVLYILANQISRIAYQNYLKSRFILRDQKAKQNLMDKEAYLRALISTIPDLLWLKSKEGTFLDCNPRFEALLNAPRDEITGKNDRDFFNEEISAAFRRNDMRALDNDGPSRNEEELTFLNDGHRETAEVIKTPVRNEKGELLGILGIGRDITERKRMENELMKTKLWLESFINSVTDGIIICDGDNRIVLINDTARSYLPEERLNVEKDISFEDIIYYYTLNGPLESPEYGKDFFELRKEISETRRCFESEISQTIHGKQHWFHTRLIKVGTGFGIISTDITEKKEAEARFRKTHEQLDSFMNSAQDLMGLFDRESRLILMNERTKEFLGNFLGEKDITGVMLDEVSPCFGNEKGIRERFTSVRKTGEPASIETKTVIGDRAQWLNIRFFKAGDGIAFIISNMTDVRELEEQLLQAQKIESIGRLAGGVAHDYNNMLGIIMGYTDLAMTQIGEDHPVRESLDEIMKASERSSQLTRQLLTFARKQNISPRSLNLNETLSGMLNMMNSLLGEHIKLIWLPGDNLQNIKMDPTQLDQIIANLCVNSRDAIDGNGEITIRTENMNLDETYCRFHSECEPGSYVALSIQDNGKGMDRESQKMIFEPFYTTKGQQGTGLGLSTVYGIIKQNKGSINVYSEPGLGTTMKLFFPVVGESVKPAPPAERTVQTGGSETILVIEDEQMILNMTAVMLGKMGYRVFKALNSEEAIELAGKNENKIDLILTDVIMPHVNGKELAEEIKKIQPRAETLFMSGYTNDIIARHGILDEGVNFIQKPFSQHSLADKVRGILNSR